jgi:hypothetical protein
VVTTNGLASNPLAFTVQNSGPAPIVSSIYPASGSVEGGGFVKITGDHFATGTKVKIGGNLLYGQILVSRGCK